ncbi:MAG: hypothetical protein IJ514_06110 [Clostridia bacterium]|nr:hypothetical protein [Clostridia bacterium]
MAEIKNHNGRPAIFINDAPYPPMMATVRTIRDQNEIVFDGEHFQRLGEAGIKIFFLICDTVWLKPNAIELFDEEARALLRAIPDAYIIPRIGLHPTNEWIQSNPDECVRYSDGSSPSVYLFTESYEAQLPAHYSLCSQKWREDAGKALEETWKLLMQLPYADRIVGCFLAAGGTSEWYYLLSTLNDENKTVLDHSPAFKREFSEYLTEKYGADENLQRHWKNANATLREPNVPDYDKHYYLHEVDRACAIPTFKPRLHTNSPLPTPPQNGTNFGAFVDLDKNPDVYDFYRAWNIGTANSILHFAKIIKSLTPDKLVGAFYGSQGCTQFARAGSCGGTVNVLHSDCVDFLAAPGVYENMLAGGCVGQREVQDSFTLHNKIYIVEEDRRTHKENRFWKARAQIYDVTDSINVLKRDFGRTLCEDVQAWWFDQLIGGERYKFPEAYELFAKQQKIAKEAYTLDRKKQSEIALIFDEESMQAVSFQTTRDGVELFRNYELARIGAPVDQYYHNDLSNPDMPDYKLYVFMNVFLLTEREREEIKAKLAKNHATAVWLYAPALLDPLATEKISTAHVEALTGIKTALINDKFDAVFRWNGDKHAISERLDKRALYGNFDRRRTMMLLSSNDPIQHWDVYLYPLVYSDDPTAQNLAYFLTSGYPAVSVKDTGAFTSVLYGSKFIKSDVVREIARFAGCHLWCEEDEVLYANNNYVTFHASSTGKKRLRFPRALSPYEVYEEKFYAHNVTELVFDAYLGETKTFRLIEE